MKSQRKPLDLSRYSRSGSDAAARTTALDALMAAAPTEVEQRARDLGLPMKYLPTGQIAPDLQQLRRLSAPDELLRESEHGDRAAAAIVEELRALGRSMKEHGQLQPIVVYPDSGDPLFPLMSHRIIMGQRRWTSAVLEALPTLWAVEVERPSRVTRVLHQHDENEQRLGLSDMERAWALQELKNALEEEIANTVPWGMVEQHFKLSAQRRFDLMRLMRFNMEGQKVIARYRWAEWTLRPLHMAISAEVIDADTATTILWELTKINEVNAPIVSTLVDHYKQAQEDHTDAVITNDVEVSAQAASADTTLVQHTGMIKQIAKLRQGIDKLADHIGSDMSSDLRQNTLREVEQLMGSLERLLQRLQAGHSD
jgi:ParB/RepB/Spo0J family partition protein